MFDSPRHILHVGGNLAQGVEQLLALYSNTLESITYIECIPPVYEELMNHLKAVQPTTRVALKAVCALVSNEDGKECDFFISSNQGQSSSIYPPNSTEWAWDWVKFVGKIRLTTATIDSLRGQGILKGGYDTLVLDTQGSELNVLQGALSLLPEVTQIQTEFSMREFYSGGVLYPELLRFLHEKGFEEVYREPGDHGDMVLKRVR